MDLLIITVLDGLTTRNAHYYNTEGFFRKSWFYLLLHVFLIFKKRDGEQDMTPLLP